LLNTKIPAVLVHIVNKLIEKEPQLRYGSDEALIGDLEKCISLLNADGNIDDFEIAVNDVRTINIGEYLYGREEQVALLDQALKQMVSNGPVSIVVSGSSGIGKTRLLEEMFHHAQSTKLMVFKGKFDLHKVSLPYTTFRQIFGQLRTWMLTRGNETQKVQLSASSTQILSFLFVELRTLLKGSHNYGVHPIENLSNKLPFAIQELFTAVATQESPLILFFDDIQWADPESLELIKKGFLNTGNPYLNIVGSYRNDEGVNETINEVFYDKNNLVQCVLKPLTVDDIINIIDDNIGMDTSKSTTLAKIIHKKTGGNPFYLKSLIDEFVESNILVFEKGQWKYNLDEVKLHTSSINITTIITAKFHKLTVEEQHYLQTLSLFSSRYNLMFTLTMMEKFGYSEKLITRMKKFGFLELTKKEYVFVHDQIHEFIYNSIPSATKQKMHLRLGKYLEKRYDTEEFKDLNLVVYHLNLGYTQGSSLIKLFKHNLNALDEMLTNNAYGFALERIRWIDENLYDHRMWESHRSYAYKYGQLKGRILYLNALHEEAEAYVHYLMNTAHNRTERMECFTLFKNICVTQGKNFNHLITYGNTLLHELGLSVNTDKTSIAQSVDELKQKLYASPVYLGNKRIVDLPLSTNKRHQSIASLLVDYWEAAYYLADIDLMQFAYLNIVDLSFRYGNTTESSFGYVLLGAQLISEKKFKQAYAFGNAALKLNHQFNDNDMLPKVHNFMANFINPYLKPFAANIALYEKSLYQSKINGDIVFGTWANFLMHFSDYLSGNSLPKLQENLRKNSDFILSSGDEKMIAIFNILVQTVNELQQNVDTDVNMEQKAITMWEKDEFYPGLGWYGILKAQTCLLEGSFEEGIKYCKDYVRTTANEVIMFPKIRLHFVRALLLMGKNTPLSADEQKLLDDDLAECKTLMTDSKNNFKFGLLLLKAESMKGDSNIWDTAKIYDAALKVAQEKKNPFFVALAGLCSSRFWNNLYYKDLGSFYLNEAVTGLNQWGAYELAAKLTVPVEKKQYMTLANSNLQTSLGRSSMKMESINFQSLLTAFYTISRTLDSTELIKVLMQTILENATASRAILILKEEEEFYTKATIDFTQGKVVMCNLLISECPFIPHKVIQYALNTGSNVLLNNPIKSDVFGLDSYIQTFRPASCNAITSSIEGKVHSILYLENESIPTPLSSESVRTLEMLLTQASIIFRNIALYDEINKSKDDLTKAQSISHLGSWNFNAATAEIKWSAEVYRIYEMEPVSRSIDYDFFIEHVHPDDLSNVLVNIEKALSGKKTYDLIHRIIAVDGTVKTVHQLAEMYWEDNIQKLSGTIQDVTERTKTLEQVSRLSQVVNQNPFSTLITDNNGVIEYVNTQCLTMTGYFEEELIGKKMSIFCSGHHDKEFYKELWNTISVQKKMWRGTIINKMKNDTDVDCSSTIFPLFDADNKIVNFVTIQEDTTEQNIKNKLLMIQTRQAQMGEMLSMIAHQWRQPLAVISSLMNKQRIDIALGDHTVDGFMESITDVDHQVQYLSRTISDFRDFFKPDKERSFATTADIFTKALGLIGHTLKNERVSVIQTHQHDKPYMTYKHEMVQVVLNLFKNAQDAFIERNISDRQLIITSDQLNDQCIISVEDNAGGIEMNIIDTLFLPYVSTKIKQNGTGLGLYMSKMIVEEHCQGILRAENTQNGAKFTMLFPIKDVDGTL
jgi:PAS domain S-box-containing protein